MKTGDTYAEDGIARPYVAMALQDPMQKMALPYPMQKMERQGLVQNMALQDPMQKMQLQGLVQKMAAARPYAENGAARPILLTAVAGYPSQLAAVPAAAGRLAHD